MGYIDKHQDGSINDGNELLYHDIAGTFCNAGMKSNILVNVAFFPGNSFFDEAAQAVQLFYVCGTGFKGGHFCNSRFQYNPYISQIQGECHFILCFSQSQRIQVCGSG